MTARQNKTSIYRSNKAWHYSDSISTGNDGISGLASQEIGRICIAWLLSRLRLGYGVWVGLVKMCIWIFKPCASRWLGKATNYGTRVTPFFRGFFSSSLFSSHSYLVPAFPAAW
ncbi:uncharacterized protein TRIVIDRAFT_216441 [Trichoderma virens Gv29-8]|uniref:Uncharacterized protein n=1 Tax=Hypocrea virens (strain Gv29-8 / FGSC 10586) TaxID=413071 RepID=G9MZT5_HYPVG|nr:uncharacterized protein TRIVIDRAFT_216441 [Trichoderma virens Gv29-8]EHK20141.1 hypothetical protein TRIVIDRAFT_216441 [Trichoderma virens Gv29-8]